MPTPLSRRRFVQAAAGTAAAVGLTGTTFAVAASPAYAADEFDTLRDTWRGLLLGKGFSPTAEPFASKLAAVGATARDLSARMAPADGSLWPDAVWADPDPDKDTESYGFSAKIQTSFAQLYAMAEAYRQPGTGLTGDTDLAEQIVTGLDHICAKVYNAGQEPYGNWYNWQIGGPQALLDTAVLLYDHLTAEQIATYCEAVDHFVPDSAVAEYSGTSTGANRIDLCRVLAVRGILEKKPAKVALASDAIAPVFPYVTKGDGIYADGSVIQHTTVAYTGSYGAVLLDGLSKLIALLGGSTWEVKAPKKQVVFDAVEASYAPFLHNGLMMDGVSGRAISRGLPPGDPKGQSDDHTRGHAIMASIVALGQGASAAENTRWRALVKGWAQRAHYRPAATDPALSVSKLALLDDVLHDGDVTAAAHPDTSSVFAAMDRVAHHRPGWAASLSMASRRITYYENGNGENLRAFHSGSGMLYWWGDDFANDQHSDRFWPTVDPYRLPGTTASAKRLADGEGGIWGAALPDVDFVGGAGDGTYAMVGQHLKGLSSTMEARKSWLFLDDAVICLGSAITAADGAAIETIVENRHLGPTGKNPLTVDGRTQPADLGWEATLDRAKWAHIQGHGGYLFPGGATLKAAREQRTGAWRDINTGGSATEFTSRYVTLWFDHGTAPKAAGYAYVLLPGADAARTARRSTALNGWLTDHTNTAAAHGARVPSLGVTGAVFWSAGSFGGLTASAPATVLVRERRDGTATISVSDPTRKLTGLTLTWNKAVRSVLSKPATVTGAATGSALKLTFGDLSATGGATQKITVRLA
ncbi:polysaccharide lyase 8 family protein [Streptomyces sp. BH105]|uniref:polysaccharide lyase 8 family protein n=1 Tax=Streptomyces sp. BH105 TaxID=3410408 RepID=UPI003CEA11C0